MNPIKRIKFLAIILTVTMSNALVASTTNTPAEQDLWLDYQYYAMKPDYLTIMGLTEKANCAISLMRSIPVANDVTALLNSSNETGQRSKIFTTVINDGLEIINHNETFKDLSDTERREMVFLYIAQHDAALTNLINITVNAEQQVPSKQEATKKTFKKFYENSNCESILGYKI
ncbi:hypothetical protein [Pseudomonas sp. NPDC079086]|uniref:hypothetical protein n=1 Tax=unclassified Pseudomonas TaxID=196821 RepID=UPI0037C845D2